MHTAFLAASVLLAQPAPDQPISSDSAAIAMIDALESYEQSVESLHWEQQEYRPPQPAWNHPEWYKFNDSERYVDQQGNWFFDYWQVIQDGPDAPVSNFHQLYAGDGVRCIAVDLEQGTGSLTHWHDMLFSVGCNVWRVMGGFQEPRGPFASRALSELLRDATSLSYLAPTPDEPWPGIRAEGMLEGRWANYDVRLDPSHDFATRLIRTRIATNASIRDQPFEEFMVVEYARAGDVWIPRVAVQGAGSLVRVDPASLDALDDREDIQLARTLAGLPDEIRTPELQTCIDHMLEPVVIDAEAGLVLMASSGPPSELLMPTVMVASRIRVNQPFERHAMFARFPRGVPVFDFDAMRWTDDPADVFFRIQSEQIRTIGDAPWRARPSRRGGAQ